MLQERGINIDTSQWFSPNCTDTNISDLHTSKQRERCLHQWSHIERMRRNSTLSKCVLMNSIKGYQNKMLIDYEGDFYLRRKRKTARGREKEKVSCHLCVTFFESVVFFFHSIADDHFLCFFVCSINGSPKAVFKLGTVGTGQHANPFLNRTNQPTQQTGVMPHYGGGAEKCARCSKSVYLAEKKTGAGRVSISHRISQCNECSSLSLSLCSSSRFIRVASAVKRATVNSMQRPYPNTKVKSFARLATPDNSVFMVWSAAYRCPLNSQHVKFVIPVGHRMAVIWTLQWSPTNHPDNVLIPMTTCFAANTAPFNTTNYRKCFRGVTMFFPNKNYRHRQHRPPRRTLDSSIWSINLNRPERPVKSVSNEWLAVPLTIRNLNLTIVNRPTPEKRIDIIIFCREKSSPMATEHRLWLICHWFRLRNERIPRLVWSRCRVYHREIRNEVQVLRRQHPHRQIRMLDRTAVNDKRTFQVKNDLLLLQSFQDNLSFSGE